MILLIENIYGSVISTFPPLIDSTVTTTDDPLVIIKNPRLFSLHLSFEIFVTTVREWLTCKLMNINYVLLYISDLLNPTVYHGTRLYRTCTLTINLRIRWSRDCFLHQNLGTSFHWKIEKLWICRLLKLRLTRLSKEYYIADVKTFIDPVTYMTAIVTLRS